MTDDDIAAGLHSALRGVRVDYDAAGADAMIAHATAAPLRPEHRAWAAPLAAAAAVVAVGGGAALLAAHGRGDDGGPAPTGGGAPGCDTAATSEPAVRTLAPTAVSSSVPAVELPVAPSGTTVPVSGGRLVVVSQAPASALGSGVTLSPGDKVTLRIPDPSAPPSTGDPCAATTAPTAPSSDVGSDPSEAGTGNEVCIAVTRGRPSSARPSCVIVQAPPAHVCVLRADGRTTMVCDVERPADRGSASSGSPRNTLPRTSGSASPTVSDLPRVTVPAPSTIPVRPTPSRS